MTMPRYLSRIVRVINYVPRKTELDRFREGTRELTPQVDELEIKLYGTFDTNPPEAEQENQDLYSSLVRRLFEIIGYVPEKDLIATRKEYNRLRNRMSRIMRTLYRTNNVPARQERQEPKIRLLQIRYITPSKRLPSRQIQIPTQAATKERPSFVYKSRIPEIPNKQEEQVFEQPYTGKKYRLASLNTREKLLTTFREMPDIEIIKRRGHGHGIHLRRGDITVPIPNSGGIKSKSIALKIFRDLGIKDRLK